MLLTLPHYFLLYLKNSVSVILCEVFIEVNWIPKNINAIIP